MFLIGASNLPMAMYTPLVVVLAAYVVLSLFAGRARSKEDTGATERFETWAFLVLLVAALYTVVLVISAVFAYPSRSTDMVPILLVILGFFALLLFAFFLIAEWIPGKLSRREERPPPEPIETRSQAR
jgi:Kef-type K+ transport system membrane component KefB